MRCEWDATKDRINLRKHGLPLSLAEEALEDPSAFVAEDHIDENGEMRYQALAMLEGRLVLITFVDRAVKGISLPRVISLRKATSMNKKSTSPTAVDRREMLARLDATQDEDIDVTDPDSRPLSPENWAVGKPFHEVYRPKKRAIALRLDVDILLWLQSQDGHYQTLINDLLRQAMERAGSARPSR